MRSVSRRYEAWIMVAILAAGAAARVLAARHELWFDEVWSMYLTKDIHGPLDAFTTIHTSNNHYLNTIWMWWLGPAQAYWMYRLPSVLSGIALFAIVSWTVVRRDHWEGVIASALVGTSVLLVHFCGEARGYMPMLLCGFLASLAMQRFLRTRSTKDLLLFSLCTSFAYLWQLTFAAWHAVLFVQSILRMRTDRPKRIGMDLVRLHGPSALFLLLLGIADLRLPFIGGVGMFMPTGRMVIEGLGQALGATPGTALSWIVGGAAALWLLKPFYRWVMCSPDWQMRALLWSVIVPCMALIALVPGIFSIRFVLPFILLLLLFVASRLRRAFAHGGHQRWGAAVLLAFILLGNAWQTIGYIQDGTRRYVDTLQYLIDHDAQEHITIGSSNDPRAVRLLWFYMPRLRGGERIEYVSEEQSLKEAPAWYLLESYMQPDRPPMLTLETVKYERIQTPDRPNTNWTLYRRTQ